MIHCFVGCDSFYSTTRSRQGCLIPNPWYQVQFRKGNFRGFFKKGVYFCKTFAFSSFWKISEVKLFNLPISNYLKFLQHVTLDLCARLLIDLILPSIVSLFLRKKNTCVFFIDNASCARDAHPPSHVLPLCYAFKKFGRPMNILFSPPPSTRTFCQAWQLIVGGDPQNKPVFFVEKGVN